MTDDVLDTILRDVLDVIPDGVFVTNTDREIIYWNEAAARIAGYTGEDVIGARCCDLLADRDADGEPLCDDRCFLVRSMETGDPQTRRSPTLSRGCSTGTTSTRCSSSSSRSSAASACISP
jgi:PAS domain-containing protein